MQPFKTTADVAEEEDPRTVDVDSASSKEGVASSADEEVMGEGTVEDRLCQATAPRPLTSCLTNVSLVVGTVTGRLNARQ